MCVYSRVYASWYCTTRNGLLREITSTSSLFCESKRKKKEKTLHFYVLVSDRSSRLCRSTEKCNTMQWRDDNSVASCLSTDTHANKESTRWDIREWKRASKREKERNVAIWVQKTSSLKGCNNWATRSVEETKVDTGQNNRQPGYIGWLDQSPFSLLLLFTRDIVFYDQYQSICLLASRIDHFNAFTRSSSQSFSTPHYNIAKSKNVSYKRDTTKFYFIRKNSPCFMHEKSNNSTIIK